MSIIAKFNCWSAKMTGYGEEIVLEAVTSETEENKVWSEATPTGRLQMTITNPAAQGQFEQGKEYFIRIEEAAS